MHLFVLYIVAAALVGYAGRSRRIGFLGFFLLSLLITPLLTVLILFLSGAPEEPRAS